MIVNKMKNIALLVVGIFFTQSTFAQNIEFKNSNFKSDKEGLKLAKENIKFADNFRDNAIIEMLAMHDAELLYSQAIFYYQKAQSFNSNNAELNYKIGSCMLFTNKKEDAFSA